MDSRRRFLQESVLAAAAVASPRLAAAGANDEIVVGIIGTGTRGQHLLQAFQRQPKCRVMALCDVYQVNLGEASKLLGGKAESYKDYRRVLERKDIDVVAIATPDHWHSPIVIDACQAGKDIYVEKPISNNIDDAVKMLDAARKHKRVIQVGLQQRSWLVYQEAYKVIKSGILGKINHAICIHRGGAGGRPIAAVESQPPPELDWEMFQGPAPRRPYTPARHRNWRNYFEYGSGIITDHGVHMTDVAYWYLGLGSVRTASGSALTLLRSPDDGTPDTISVVWKYDNLLMTFGSWNAEGGNYFWGENGVLHVNRFGYSVKPLTQPRFPRPGQGAAPGAVVPPRPSRPALEPIEKQFENDYPSLDTSLGAHVRNFLDCVRTRQRPITDIEVGFESTLPTLLGAMAMRQGRTFAWDGRTARPV